MSAVFTPRPYQVAIIDHVLAHPRAAVWARPGMGKTSASLAVEVAHQEIDGGKALVIAPKRVARDVWPDEARKWKQFEHLEVSPVIGSVVDRERALAKQAHVYTINYDNLPWLIEWAKAQGRWPFARVYADESTRLKSFRLGGGKRVEADPDSMERLPSRGRGGRRAGAIGQIAHSHVRRWTNLTGTPSPNGLMDLWGQLWFLDRGERLGRTIEAFKQRWFSVGYDGAVHARQGAQEEIHAVLRDICVTLDPRDWFDLREPVVSNVYVDLPPSARGVYRDMERRFFAEIASKQIEANTSAARSIKLLQFANGAAYYDDEDERAVDVRGPRKWVHVHDEKIEALESIVSEWDGSPLLVAYQFRSDRERLLKAFRDSIDVSTDEGLKAAKRGEGKLWLAHPASMGHGIDGLQHHCYGVVFFGHWWSLEEYEQIIERVGPVRQAQAGRDRTVHVYHIYARDTIDELVDVRRRTKAEVQQILLDAVRRRGMPT